MSRGAASHVGLGLVAAACGAVGYALGDLRAAAALVGAAALAAWGLFAFRRPRTALAASIPLLLVAGTKFRVRDADASLAGVVDAQIVLELGLFAAVAVAVVAARGGSTLRAIRIPVRPLVCAYVGFALASALWSAAPALTFVRATQLAIIAALAMTAVQLLTAAAALRAILISTAAFASACAALALLVPWAQPLAAGDDGAARFAWFAVHPIEAATLAGLGALGCLALGTLRGPALARPATLPYLAWAGALMVVLVLTGSRGPMLALSAGLAILLLMQLRLPARVPIMLGATAALLAALAVAPNVRPLLDRMDDSDSAVARIIFRGGSADSVLELNGRLELWDDVRPAVAAQPLVGYGYQASRPIMLDAAPWAAYAHNALLQTLLDLGLLGTVLLSALLIAAGVACANREMPQQPRAAIAALVTFLAMNSISTEGFAGAPGLEALVLFTCAMSVTRRRRVRTPQAHVGDGRADRAALAA